MGIVIEVDNDKKEITATFKGEDADLAIQYGLIGLEAFLAYEIRENLEVLYRMKAAPNYFYLTSVSEGYPQEWTDKYVNGKWN